MPTTFPHKCRLFIDEVGNGDLKGAARDDNVRYLSLSGVLAPIPVHDTTITPELNEFKQDIFGTKEVILHRRDIVRREGIFSELENEEKQHAFNTRLLLLLRGSPYLLTTVTIDKREHLLRYSAWQYDPWAPRKIRFPDAGAMRFSGSSA